MFCIITPVFEEAFATVPGLIQDLKEQTYNNFQHVMISNGASPIIKKIIGQANDNRFIYVEAPHEETPKLENVLVNIAKRRNYATEKFEAERYFFFDADLLVYANNFFEVIFGLHEKADVILSKILLRDIPRVELPIFPIKKGNIDIANYSFSKRMADKYKYCTHYPDLKNGIANDWAFYDQMKDEEHYFNDMCYAKKDGRALYRNLSTRYISERMRGTI